jgi:hypothetical protein
MEGAQRRIWPNGVGILLLDSWILTPLAVAKHTEIARIAK